LRLRNSVAGYSHDPGSYDHLKNPLGEVGPGHIRISANEIASLMD
jgi:hypothetical protein